MKNALYYGDNLEVLRLHVQDESVDLIYLDPPFKSDQDYNVLFAEHDGTKSAAQILAFEDTWEWNTEAERHYEAIVERGGKASEVMRAFRTFLGTSDMMSYLAMMAPRLVELRRVLNATGTIYLHCDPTASHYLKMLMDAIFGPQRFLNEITWKRTHSHGNVGRNFGSICDALLVYTKNERYRWSQQFTLFADEYVEKIFKFEDSDGRRWQSVTLRNPGRRPNLHYPYTASNGITYRPHPNGWACDPERMKRYDRENRLHFPNKPTGALRLKMYFDESNGVRLQNLWDDITAIGSKAAERLGYPTQKPQALLERIIATSSSEGDTILDPFCGCGTAIEAAQKLDRRWTGIDITHLAVGLIKYRLQNAFGDSIRDAYEVIGEPVTVRDAEQLAHENPFQFQCWALGLVGARSSGQQKGADKGIDGRLFFHDERVGATKQIIFSVKSGTHLSPVFVRELRGVLDREKAQIGVLITLHRPTREMLKEAVSCGFYESHWGKHPRLQILTVEQLLNGEGIDRPPTREVDVTLKKRPRSVPKLPKQLRLPH